MRCLSFIYYYVPSFETLADIFMTNTERRVKISAGISKQGT